MERLQWAESYSLVVRQLWERAVSICDLHAIGRSLQQAFGKQLAVELLESEIKITLSNKSIWISRSGEITGETSGIGPAALSVGVDAIGTGVTSTGATIAPGVDVCLLNGARYTV